MPRKGGPLGFGILGNGDPDPPDRPDPPRGGGDGPKACAIEALRLMERLRDALGFLDQARTADDNTQLDELQRVTKDSLRRALQRIDRVERICGKDMDPVEDSIQLAIQALPVEHKRDLMNVRADITGSIDNLFRQLGGRA